MTILTDRIPYNHMDDCRPPHATSLREEATEQSTRESLLSRLRDWMDTDSWNEFFRLYWNLIYSVAIRSGLSDAEAQDVVQETLLTVARRMPEFQYDRSKGSFRGWLGHTTRWRIKDQFKRRQRQQRLENKLAVEADEVCPVSFEADFESMWAAEWEENLTHLALDAVRPKVGPKAYEVFELFTIRGWSAARIARRLKLNQQRVYYLNRKAYQLLEEESARIRGKLE